MGDLFKMDEERVIYTDHEITKFHIWDSYNGFKSFYMNWSMGNRYGKDKVHVSLGVAKYAEEFLIQISTLLDDEKLIGTIDKVDLGKANKLITKIKEGIFDPAPVDLHFLRLFAESFLSATGMKDVTRVKSDPGKALGR